MNRSLEHDRAVPAAATPFVAREAAKTQSAWRARLDDALIVVGRLLLATPFIYSGVWKIEHYAQTGALMQGHGVPSVLLPLVIALELGGGSALALGFLTRLTAAVLAAFSVAAITIFLLPDPTAATLAVVELAMVGGLCGLAARGGGHFSIDDAWRRVRESRR